MTANSLFPWGLVKMSAMKLQKTETTKRAKTLTQTKKTRPRATWLASGSVRSRT